MSDTLLCYMVISLVEFQWTVVTVYQLLVLHTDFPGHCSAPQLQAYTISYFLLYGSASRRSFPFSAEMVLCDFCSLLMASYAWLGKNESDVSL